MKKFVIASRNKNKIIEMTNKFSSLGDIELIPVSSLGNIPDVIEDGNSFEENARKKASEIALHTGLPVIADDSGLVVDALDGRPGILSARYGGENLTDSDRNALLLKEMKDISDDKRDAKFVCVIAIVLPDGQSLCARGECKGTISHVTQGSRGFGYDPIFFLPQYNCTMAEIELEEKNKISHRARALDKAFELLENFIKKE